MSVYSPEGQTAAPPAPETLRRAAATGEIFQAMCMKCDEFHNLHVDLGTLRGIIPREEAALGVAEGRAREISILSRVGKPVSFQVLAFDRNGTAILSRRAAQEEARRYFLETLQPGDIIPAVVQAPAEPGAFCDIGCGYTALMRIDRCCISRLPSARELFRAGERIHAAVLRVDAAAGQIQLTGREVLGTWEENAALYRPGQTVTGTVRSIMPYGIFVELTPNLSGLAEYRDGLAVGDAVIAYIRAIQYQKHKVKLNILEVLPQRPAPGPVRCFRTEGHMDRWEYYPGSRAVTVF